MDCLVCYRVYIPEIDYSIEVPERSSVYANSICKLLSIPFQPVFEEIFKDSSICIKCHRRFGEVNKLINELELLQGKLIEFQEQIEVELLQSKKVGEIFDENEAYTTTSTRCKLVKELKRYNALSSIEILGVQSNYNDFSSNDLPTPISNPLTSNYDYEHPLKSSDHGSEESYNYNNGHQHQQNSDDENGMASDMASDIVLENEDDGYCNTEVLNYLEDIEIDYHIDGPNPPDSSTSNDYKYSPGIIKDVRIHVEPIQIPIETLRARSVNIHEEPLASYIARDKAHAQKLQNSHNFELSPMFVSRKRTKRFTNEINFDASLYEYNGNGEEEDIETICNVEGCYFHAKNPRGLRIHRTLIHGYDPIDHLNAKIKKEPLERPSMNENESQNEMNEEGNHYDGFAEFMASNGVQTQLNEGHPQHFNVQRKRYRHTVFSKSRRFQEFKCKFCRKRLANKNSLSRHIVSFHQGGNGIAGNINIIQNKQISKSKPRTCSLCKVICPSKHVLIRHMKIHNEKYFCQYCDKGFSQQGAYDKHHEGELSELISCENCEKNFKNQNCLVYHRINVHKSRFLCTLCGKNFLKRYMFERHQKELSSNGGGKVYRCKVCKVEFLGNACFRYHSRFIHPLKENGGIYSVNDEDSYDLEEHETSQPLSSIESIEKMKISTEKILFQDFSSPDNPFKCKVCLRIFSSTSALQTHSLIHLNATPYKCRYLCGLKFRHIASRNRHEVVHKNTNMPRVDDEYPTPPKKLQVKRVQDRNTQCNVCSRVFSSKSNLKIHTRHILVSNRTLRCRFCKRSFKSSACLLHHEKQHKLKSLNNLVQRKTENIEDNNDESLQQIEFENIDQLIEQTSSSSKNVAIKLEKPNAISFPCPIPGCYKGFFFKSRLKKHLLTHSTARPYVCKVEGCGKDFRTRQGLNKHSYDHVENKPYSCKICLKTFVIYPHLKRHLARTHIKIQREQREQRVQSLNDGNVGTKIISPSKNRANAVTVSTNQEQDQNGEKCRFCNLTFISSAVLNDHINIVHTSQRTYVCGRSKCGKSFKTSSMLQEHSKTHAKKSLKCEFCGLRLSTEALYLIHRNLHTKEKSYTCRDESCGNVYYNPSTLYSHERSFHPNLKSLDKPRIYSRHPKVNQSLQSQSPSSSISSNSSGKKNVRANFETAKFFCGVCHEQFNELEVLERHLKFKCKTPVAVK